MYIWFCQNINGNKQVQKLKQYELSLKKYSNTHNNKSYTDIILWWEES